jgi:hypothetical protein
MSFVHPGPAGMLRAPTRLRLGDDDANRWVCADWSGTVVEKKQSQFEHHKIKDCATLRTTPAQMEHILLYLAA